MVLKTISPGCGVRASLMLFFVCFNSWVTWDNPLAFPTPHEVDLNQELWRFDHLPNFNHKATEATYICQIFSLKLYRSLFDLKYDLSHMNIVVCQNCK